MSQAEKHRPARLGSPSRAVRRDGLAMSAAVSLQELLEKGLYHYGLGEIETALHCWREVLKLDPGNETAREYIEIETGKTPTSSPPAAPPAAADAPAVEPVKAPAAKAPQLSPRFISGQGYLSVENFEAAIEAFEAAHREDPSNPIYWAHVELARARLIKEVAARVGGRGSAIRLKASLTELIGEKRFTQEEGFVLSMITGDTSLEDVISLSPIPRFKSYQIIYRLLRDGLADSVGARAR